MSRRRRRLVEIVLGTIASVALVLSILTAAGAVTLPGLNGGDNDLLALGQGAGQTPDKVPTVRRAEPPLVATPRAKCGPGSQARARHPGPRPRGLGDQRPVVQHDDGRPPGHVGRLQGLRYVDAAGPRVRYYDTALLFPLNAVQPQRERRSASRCST